MSAGYGARTLDATCDDTDPVGRFRPDKRTCPDTTAHLARTPVWPHSADNRVVRSGLASQQMRLSSRPHRDAGVHGSSAPPV
jgi:hypothetical protein